MCQAYTCQGRSEDYSVSNSDNLSNSVELAGRPWLVPFRNHRNKNRSSTTRILSKRHFDSIPLQLTAKITSKTNGRTKMKVVEKKGGEKFENQNLVRG